MVKNENNQKSVAESSYLNVIRTLTGIFYEKHQKSVNVNWLEERSISLVHHFDGKNKKKNASRRNIFVLDFRNHFYRRVWESRFWEKSAEFRGRLTEPFDLIH